MCSLQGRLKRALLAAAAAAVARVYGRVEVIFLGCLIRCMRSTHEPRAPPALDTSS